MIQSVDQLSRRVETLYGERQSAPAEPSLYLVHPPSELEQAKDLVTAFLREIPKLMLLFVALGVVGIRRCWLWLKQWKKVPRVG